MNTMQILVGGVVVLFVILIYILSTRNALVKKRLTYDMLKDYIGGKIVFADGRVSGTIQRLQSHPEKVILFYSVGKNEWKIPLDCENFRHDTVGDRRYIAFRDGSELLYLEKLES